MGRLGLREAPIGRLLDGVDQVRELDRVLDEEDRDVVADEIPVALLRVELHGEAAHVAGEIERALVAGDGREADEDLGVLAGSLEQVGAGDVGQGLVVLENAVGAIAAGVHHALGDPLVVEVEDLLAEREVLEQRRPPLAGLQRVLVIGDRDALLRREPRCPPPARLMGLAARPGWSINAAASTSVLAASAAGADCLRRVRGAACDDRGAGDEAGFLAGMRGPPELGERARSYPTVDTPIPRPGDREGSAPCRLGSA